MKGEGGPGVRSLREGRPWGQRIGGKCREQEGVCLGLCGPKTSNQILQAPNGLMPGKDSPSL